MTTDASGEPLSEGAAKPRCETCSQGSAIDASMSYPMCYDCIMQDAALDDQLGGDPDWVIARYEAARHEAAEWGEIYGRC